MRGRLTKCTLSPKAIPAYGKHPLQVNILLRLLGQDLHMNGCGFQCRGNQRQPQPKCVAQTKIPKCK